MLKQLTINSFTLIAEASVPFHEGFTAITGETGAGKSVLMKALRMVCGDKSQASMVRTGEADATCGTYRQSRFRRTCPSRHVQSARNRSRSRFPSGGRYRFPCGRYCSHRQSPHACHRATIACCFQGRHRKNGAYSPGGHHPDHHSGSKCS